MRSHENGQIPPRPWRVVVDGDDFMGIVDANGAGVIETDSGFYPPNIETANLIVKLVNEAA